MNKRKHASLLRTATSVPLNSKQKTLFSAGFWTEKTTKDGDVVRIDDDAHLPSPTAMDMYKFPHCDYQLLSLYMRKRILSGRKSVEMLIKC